MNWTSKNIAVVETWGLRGGIGGYQDRAINALIENPRGIIVAPAGSGKTIIAARAVEACLIEARNLGAVGIRSLLWIANTTEQVDQAEKALALIHAGLVATVRCVSSALLAELESENAELPDYLVIDEAHHGAAGTWESTIRRASGKARRVMGFTATDHREDGDWAKVEELIGPVVCRIEAEEVETGGHRTSARVRIVTGAAERGEIEKAVEKEVFGEREDGPPMVERAWAKARWEIKAKGTDAGTLRQQVEARCIQQFAVKLGICEHAMRNGAAARIAALHVATGDSVLVLVYSVEQGRAIAAQVPGSRLVFSRMKVREDGRRADIIAGFRDGTIPCLVATSLADEGFDAPRASVLVQVGGGRGISKAEDAFGKFRVTGRLVQRAGRVQRKHGEKEIATIYDFDDVHHRFLASQAKTRRAGYRALGFDIAEIGVAAASGLMFDDSAPSMFDRAPKVVRV